MARYLTTRFISSALTILVVITLTFFLMRLMPGSPFTSERISKTALENMNAKYGLDKPWSEQYVIFMKNVLKGDFGTSMQFKGREVTRDIIFKFFPNSAKVGTVAIIYALLIGLTLGLLAGMNQGRWQDKLSMVIATLGITIPPFVIISAMRYLFSIKLQLLPATGFDSWKNYIIPVLALSGSSLAFITRLTRTKFVEVKKSDFIRTARAKGLSPFTVNVKHGLRNSIIPVVTYIGPMIASILTGSFVVEKMSAIPGLGRDFVGSVLGRDYSVVMGVVSFYCIFIIVCNLLVDILYVVIDPRIKLDNANS